MIAVDLHLYYSLCVPRRMLFSSGRKVSGLLIPVLKGAAQFAPL